jgi:hypothetical protein
MAQWARAAPVESESPDTVYASEKNRHHAMAFVPRGTACAGDVSCCLYADFPPIVSAKKKPCFVENRRR